MASQTSLHTRSTGRLTAQNVCEFSTFEAENHKLLQIFIMKFSLQIIPLHGYTLLFRAN